MSANNWDTCPKCMHEAKAGVAAKKAAAEAAYGTVPASDYRELAEAAEMFAPPKDTLREDFEIGITENEFYMSYRGSCDVCGFEYSYIIRKPVFDPETGKATQS